MRVIFGTILLCCLCANVFGFIPQDYDSNKRVKSVLVPPSHLKFYKKKVSDYAIKPSTVPISSYSKPDPANRRSWLFGGDDEDQETAAEDRIFFPPYKFPFWGLPYGVYSNGGFFNPGLFPFVPGGPGFPPYDGIFGGPFGPGEFPGPGPTPFTEQNATSGLAPPSSGGPGGVEGPGGSNMPGGTASMPGGSYNGSYYSSTYSQSGSDNYHDYHHSFPPMPDGGSRASRSAELNKFGKEGKEFFKKGKKKGKKAKVVAPVPVMTPPQVAYPAQQLPTYTVKPIKGKLVQPQIIEANMAQPLYPSYGSGSYGGSIYGGSSYSFPYSLGYAEPYGPQYEHKVPMFGAGPVPMYSGYAGAPPYPSYGHYPPSYAGNSYYPPPYGGHGYQPPYYGPSKGAYDHKKYKSKDKPAYPSDGHGPPDKYMYPYGGNHAYTSTPAPYTPPPAPYAPPPSYTPAPPPEDTTAAPAPPPEKPKKAKATYVTNVIQYACGSSGHYHYPSTPAPSPPPTYAPPSPPPTYAPTSPPPTYAPTSPPPTYAPTTTTTAYTTTLAPPPETTYTPAPPPVTTTAYVSKQAEGGQSGQGPNPYDTSAANQMPPPPVGQPQQPYHNEHSDRSQSQHQNQYHHAGQQGQHYPGQNYQPHHNQNAQQPWFQNPQYQTMNNQQRNNGQMQQGAMQQGPMQQSSSDQHYMPMPPPQNSIQQQPQNYQQPYQMPNSPPVDQMQASSQNYLPSHMNPPMQQHPNQHQEGTPEPQPWNGPSPGPMMSQYPQPPPQVMPPVPPQFLQNLAEPEWDPMDPMGMGPVLYSVPGYNRRQSDSSQPGSSSRQTRVRAYKSIQTKPIKFKNQTPELLKIPASWSKKPVGSGRVPKPQQQISARADTDSSKTAFVANQNTIPEKLDDVVKISVEETISSVSKHASSSTSPFQIHKRSKRNAPRRGPPPRRPLPHNPNAPYPNRFQNRKKPCCRQGDSDKPHLKTPLRPRYPPRTTTVRPRYNQGHVTNSQQYGHMPIPNAPIPQPVPSMPLVSEVPVLQVIPIPIELAPAPVLPANPGPPATDAAYPSDVAAVIPLPPAIEAQPMYPQATEYAQPSNLQLNHMPMESEAAEQHASKQTGDIYADHSSVIPQYSTPKSVEGHGSYSKSQYQESGQTEPVSPYTSEEHLAIPEASPYQSVVDTTSFNHPSTVDIPDLKPLGESFQAPPAIPVPNAEVVSIHLPEITPVIYGSQSDADTAVVGIPIPNSEPLPPIIKDFKVEEYQVPMPPPVYLPPGTVHSSTAPEIASKIVPSYAAETSLTDYRPIQEILNSSPYSRLQLPNRWANQDQNRRPSRMPYHQQRSSHRYPRMNTWRRGEDSKNESSSPQLEGTQTKDMDPTASQIMSSQPQAQGPTSEDTADSTLLTFNLDHDTPTKLGYRIGVYSQSDPNSKGVSSAFAAVGPKNIIAYAKAPSDSGAGDQIKYVHDQEAGLMAFRSPSKESMALGFIENRDKLREYEFLDDYTWAD